MQFFLTIYFIRHNIFMSKMTAKNGQFAWMRNGEGHKNPCRHVKIRRTENLQKKGAKKVARIICALMHAVIFLAVYLKCLTVFSERLPDTYKQLELVRFKIILMESFFTFDFSKLRMITIIQFKHFIIIIIIYIFSNLWNFFQHFFWKATPCKIKIFKVISLKHY